MREFLEALLHHYQQGNGHIRQGTMHDPEYIDSRVAFTIHLHFQMIKTRLIELAIGIYLEYYDNLATLKILGNWLANIDRQRNHLNDSLAAEIMAIYAKGIIKETIEETPLQLDNPASIKDSKYKFWTDVAPMYNMEHVKQVYVRDISTICAWEMDWIEEKLKTTTDTMIHSFLAFRNSCLMQYCPAKVTEKMFDNQGTQLITIHKSEIDPIFRYRFKVTRDLARIPLSEFHHTIAPAMTLDQATEKLQEEFCHTLYHFFEMAKIHLTAYIMSTRNISWQDIFFWYHLNTKVQETKRRLQHPPSLNHPENQDPQLHQPSNYLRVYRKTINDFRRKIIVRIFTTGHYSEYIAGKILISHLKKIKQDIERKMEVFEKLEHNRCQYPDNTLLYPQELQREKIALLNYLVHQNPLSDSIETNKETFQQLVQQLCSDENSEMWSHLLNCMWSMIWVLETNQISEILSMIPAVPKKRGRLPVCNIDPKKQKFDLQPVVIPTET